MKKVMAALTLIVATMWVHAIFHEYFDLTYFNVWYGGTYFTTIVIVYVLLVALFAWLVTKVLEGKT